MLSNKVRNDSWWLLKCFDYLAGPLAMADQNRNNFTDFRRVIEERMAGYAKEIEVLEAKLEKEKARVALEITEKPPPTPSNAPIQHVNQFVEIVQPRPLWPSAAAPTSSPPPPVASQARVTVVKESPTVSPVKTKVALPPVAVEEPEAEDEDEVADEDADAEDAEAEDADAEDAEAEDAEEEEEEEQERDWVAWRHRKNTYWHDQISHEVYTCAPDNSVGELVGKYVLVNGIASLSPA
jgi:hypothetical protein